MKENGCKHAGSDSAEDSRPWRKTVPPTQEQEPAQGTLISDEPRFGVIHLLVWSIVTAVFVGLSGGGADQLLRGSIDGAPSLLLSLLGCLLAVRTGAALSGLVLLASRRWRNRQFPRHPGEWLWTAMGVSSLGEPFVRASGQYQVYLNAWGNLCPWLVTAAVLVAARLRVREDRWRRFLTWLIATILLNTTLLLVNPWWSDELISCLRGPGQKPGHVILELRSMHACLWLFAATILACAILPLARADRREGLRFPWTHYAGLAAFLCWPVTALWQALTYGLLGVFIPHL